MGYLAVAGSIQVALLYQVCSVILVLFALSDCSVCCHLLQYAGHKAEKDGHWEIPALLRLKIWLGLEKDESEWHKMQKDGELAVYAETV